MNTNSVQYIERLIKLNDDLLGLPALPLVFIASIVFGYMWKVIPVFNNRWIPAVVFFGGIILNFCMNPHQPTASWGVWFGRNFCLGAITSGAAWVFHRVVLKKVERRFGLFDGAFDTNFTPNPDPPKPPTP